MKGTLVLLFLGWMATVQVSPDLATVRETYRKASESEAATKKLFDDLMTIGKNDDITLVAYKGAITTKMADYAEGVKDKKDFFKQGREFLEHAIETAPENVEIRCIRLSVQENVPKITGYHKNRDEDKQYILSHYNTIKNDGAKMFVKGYVSQSDTFTDAEKQLF